MNIKPVKAERSNLRDLSPYQIERERKLDEVYICKECGKEYTPRQYVIDSGLKTYSNPGYCSAKCRKNALNRIIHKSHKIHKVGENHRRRARKYGCEYDSSVTLPKLIRRDGLRCAICGEMCDPDDHSWTKYFGALSPTIDHIIPLAKGGGHTWDNVQIAHMICNSKKGSGVKEVV